MTLRSCAGVPALVLVLCAVGCGDDGIDGSGAGPSGDGGSSSGGSSDGGWGEEGGSYGDGGGGEVTPPPAPVAPPPDEPPVGCEGLDPERPAVLYVSADDSNSMASPVHARESLKQGSAFVGSIRTYEFFNYYRFDYPAPPAGELGLFAEADVDTEPGSYALQFAVRSYQATERRPMTITFVLDTSGSMEGQGMERERAAILALASKLQQGDVLNMVTWNTAQNVLFTNHPVSGPNDPVVVGAVNALQSDGGTDLHNGLVTGYALAEESYDPQRLNRLILISDGGANVGVTDADLIGDKAALDDDEGIYLVGIGTGPFEYYNDELMDVVTDEGRGAYVYLDDASEAQRILADRFDEVMEVAARGVQVQLTLPWYFQMKRFYGEEYSEDPLEVKPQHLAPSDAMVFLQTIRACDPSVVVPSDPISIKATWQTPLAHVEREIETTTTLGELLGAPKTQLAKGRAIAAYADALRSGLKADLDAALALVQNANLDGADVDLNEIRQLIESHPAR